MLGGRGGGDGDAEAFLHVAGQMREHLLPGLPLAPAVDMLPEATHLLRAGLLPPLVGEGVQKLRLGEDPLGVFAS
ncbi:hypothetical protein [Nonomuraea jabiensis]|uniref:hypothetical protein n=1 Tax=Nonomuraea jabiensis TaxID=882448 RepID=UPI003D7082EB